MNTVSYERNDDVLNLALFGRIDSTNAREVESEILRILDEGMPASVVVDLDKLEYISSAGLRVILKLKKAVNDTKFINASPAVYDIFEVTGFSEMMEVTKAYRVISVEGCEVIGKGANGEVYRIDRDTIVKVYNNPDSLPEIHRERELARTAFISGVPTAIPYDVVRIEGGGYGSVFELLNAKCFVDLIAKDHRPIDEVVAMSIDLLKTMHASTVDPGIMPSMKEVASGWVDSVKGFLPEENWKKLRKMMDEVPEDNHMLHGDYHLKNIMLQNGESLLIDMDTLCHGNPIFEFGGMFFTYVAFDEIDPPNTERFLGISHDTTGILWDKSIRLYLEGKDEETIQAAMTKAKIIGYIHLMDHQIKRGGINTEQGQKKIDLCIKRLGELLPQVDTLTW